MTCVESTWIAAPAAAFFEAVPFLLGAALLQREPRLRAMRAASYLGCGCGTGPSARSLPAALLTAMIFGPWVAAARWIGAILCAWVLRAWHLRQRARPRSSPEHCPRVVEGSPLTQLAALWPAALAASLTPLLMGALGLTALPAVPAFLAGTLAGFVSAPCALGTPAVAAALRALNPAFALGFLCVAGIADVRTFVHAHGSTRAWHDAFAYGMLALACALVALRGGAQLVHPYFAFALAPCAAVFAVLAFAHRREAYGRARIVPAAMLAGVFIAAPPPEYHATETTLVNVFAGEHIVFTGIATQTGHVTTVVRYAITCCRADAAPEVLRLEPPQPRLHGWIRANGTMVAHRSGLALRLDSVERVAPPGDPFIYR